MSIPMIERRRLLVLLGTLFVCGGGGIAYAVSSGNPANGPSPVSGEAALRSFFAARAADMGKPELAPAPRARVASIATTVDGSEWSVSTYRNSAGQLCFSESAPADGRAYSCQNRIAIFAKGPLYVSWGSKQEPGGDLTQWDKAWVLGFATSPITKVELVFRDCSVKTLPLNGDGAFFAVVGQQAMHGGSWPYLVRAFSEDGTVIATDRADLEQPNAHGVVIKAPPLAATCS